MKESYIAPELSVIEFSLKDVILSSPTEGNIPGQGSDLPPDPGDIPSLDDLP